MCTNPLPPTPAVPSASFAYLLIETKNVGGTYPKLLTIQQCRSSKKGDKLEMWKISF